MWVVMQKQVKKQNVQKINSLRKCTTAQIKMIHFKKTLMHSFQPFLEPFIQSN